MATDPVARRNSTRLRAGADCILRFPEGSLTRNRNSSWTCLLLLHCSNAANQEAVQPARRGWEAIAAFSHPAMMRRDTSEGRCVLHQAASCGLASLPWARGRDRLKDN